MAENQPNINADQSIPLESLPQLREAAKLELVANFERHLRSVLGDSIVSGLNMEFEWQGGTPEASFFVEDLICMLTPFDDDDSNICLWVDGADYHSWHNNAKDDDSLRTAQRIPEHFARLRFLDVLEIAVREQLQNMAENGGVPSLNAGWPRSKAV